MNKTNKPKRNRPSFTHKKRRDNSSNDETRENLPERKGRLWLFGTHAVLAALANPKRHSLQLLLTKETYNTHSQELDETLKDKSFGAEFKSRSEIDDFLPAEAVHQGIALLVDPLPGYPIEQLLKKVKDQETACVVILDQPNDPHNIGAVLRSAAAFGADAVIMPDRGTPEATGTLAKSACGALERVPVMRVGNLSRVMEQLKEAGFWCAGLDAHGDTPLAKANLDGKTALVFGAEGPGLRRLTKEKCDFLIRVPISNAVESLNLSNAVAITLYEVARNKE
ncbi:MAG: 23S rRNA (guanosine(2251)-2'-O)-methyltransferase RlmB [Alphaproteobacteria bacterium]|nr:23S rRNA (guanosine(2251)-2'-O)-methyltransferase RlmB [Alphaproteobacteria bacterium]